MRLLSLCVHDTKKGSIKKCVDRELKGSRPMLSMAMKYIPNDEINSMDSMCWMIAIAKRNGNGKNCERYIIFFDIQIYVSHIFFLLMYGIILFRMWKKKTYSL